MGFFGKLKQAFSSGGVKVQPHLPNTLKTGAEELAFSADFINTTDEERTVTLVTFRLNDIPSGEEPSAQERSRTGSSYQLEEPFTLAPGETRNIEVVMPLTISGAVGAAGVDVPDWMQKAEGVLSKVQGATSKSRGHIFDITVSVDGFKGARTTTKRIGRGFHIG